MQWSDSRRNLNVLKRLWSWNKTKVEDHNKQKRDSRDKLDEIDKRLDSDQGQMTDVEDRVQLTKFLLDIDRKDTLDLAQKAKIKWVIEGDENSKYFMGL